MVGKGEILRKGNGREGPLFCCNRCFLPPTPPHVGSAPSLGHHPGAETPLLQLLSQALAGWVWGWLRLEARQSGL